MSRRGVVAGGIVVAMLVVGVVAGGVAAEEVAADAVVAQDDEGVREGSEASEGDKESEGDDESEGGIEGLVGGFLDRTGLVGTTVVLAAGGLLLTACVDRLVGYLTRAAFGLRVSLFGLAVLFTGVELDDTVLALVLSGGDLEGAALGTALGTGLAVVGVTLALAAVVRPFSVDLPTDYVALFALGPVLLFPFVLAGTLTFVHGLLLLGAFALTFGYVLVREYRRETPVFRTSDLGRSVRSDGGHDLPASVAAIPEDRVVAGRTGSGWLWISLAVGALAGIVFASMLLEAGSEVVVESAGIDGTVFGATVLTAILTFEDLLLTLEPVRRGVPEIGVGNVLGSVLFSLTGNVGVVVLVGDLTISQSVLTFHLPAVVVVTVLAACFFHGGRLERRHGYLLGACYATYWVVALVAFGGVPVGG